MLLSNSGFNTLKNLGYNFEHNFGHGKQNLCNNLAVIMMLVFLVDQLQHLACKLFQKAVEKERRLSYLWDHMRGYFHTLYFKNWQELLAIMAYGIKPIAASDVFDTS